MRYPNTHKCLLVFAAFICLLNAKINLRMDLNPEDHIDIYDHKFTPENTVIFENDTFWMSPN